MKNSELFKFACHCLILDEHPELAVGIKEKIISGEADIYRLIRLCSNQLVLPAIYRQLQNAGIFELLPKDIDEHLDEIYQLNSQRNKKILQQIDEINLHLYKEYIELVYLKGTANMLDNFYLNPGDRFIGDIDLLVKEKDYFKTADLIKQLGYKQSEVKIFDELNTIKHYPRLYREDAPANVEIHRIPVVTKYSKNFNSDNIFDKKVTIQTIQNSFVTCNEHKLIHTFIHSQLSNNGYSYRIASLRDLYDFYLISKRVDFYSVLPEIEQKHKASSFFNLVQCMFEPEISAGYVNYQMNNKYVRQITWFLNHPKQHRFYINFVKVIDIFIERPFLKIKNALLNKSSRNSLIIRLKNPAWYNTIYNGIKSYFNY